MPSLGYAYILPYKSVGVDIVPNKKASAKENQWYKTKDSLNL
ncbi:hypothetical protein [Nostoc commune]|nr:hypothetical protein [Nostoc commune]